MGFHLRSTPWASFALALFAAIGLLANVARVCVSLPLIDEGGYPDAYMLYDAREYAQTGRIYRPADEAPHNPTLYSPLFYLVLSVPFRFVAEPANPFLIPRVVVMGFFAVGLLMSVSLAKALARHRAVVLWAAALAPSVTLFNFWIPQLRVDFMGAAFGLVSVRILLSRLPHAALLAGLAAGLAFAFKLTLVASAAAGLLWLLLDRRWRHALEFSAGAAVTGLGGYLAFLPFEPHMLDHVTMLGTPLREYRGWLQLLYGIAREPVFLLALAALPLALRRPRGRTRLLLLYASFSLLGAVAALTHPGANGNYFIEPLLACVPFAALAAVRLSTAIRSPVSQALIAAMILAFEIRPALGKLGETLTQNVAVRNAQWIGLERLLHDRHVFSTITSVAYVSHHPPPITEPYLIRFLEMAGKYDAEPLAARLRAREFELVVTLPKMVAFRGVLLASPAFSDAILAGYAPHCELGGALYHLPRDDRDVGELRSGLAALGCISVKRQ